MISKKTSIHDRPRPSKWEAIAPFTLFLSTLIVLASGLTDYGFTWDEAETNFPAARNQAAWFRGLAKGETGFTEESIRKHFETESDHPSLPRTLMALGRFAFPDSYSDRFAFRLPVALIVSLFTAAFFWFLQRSAGIFPAIAGTLFLVFHPRWFAHSHLAEYDILIAVAWWAAAVSYMWAFSETETLSEREKWTRAIIASSLFGLALATKLHAFFLPFPLLAWTLLFRRWEAWRWAVLSAFLGPALYLGSQPYLWWNTLERLQNRFLDYSQKVPITTYYLGEWYPGNVPWHYPWVLLAATLPVGFFLFALVGVAGTLRNGLNSSIRFSPRMKRCTFYILNAITTPLIFSWKSPYDGIRLFIIALPFLAMIAAEGMALCYEFLLTRPNTRRRPIVFVGAIAVLILLQIASCYRCHPFQLAYYSPLIGGVRGAHALGFETTYWCDALNDDFIDSLKRELEGPQNIALHAMDTPPWEEFRKEGKIPVDWRFNQPGFPDLHIVQFRQGFFGPFERRLVESHADVLAENQLFGVPLIRAYKRPE
ncbi:MAG: glycosyltransferase family 39 protein [Candidatus Omnitrophica bacterium]|nr:glycosyltransferase family 39 protein [Candidatus Omnitrophota bacterium]